MQTLSSNPNACLGLASEHLGNVMQSLKDSISEDQQRVHQVAFFVVTFNSQNVSSLFHQYEEETKKMREQIDELRTTPRIFQSRNCHACTVQASDGLIFILMTDILGGSGLDMPSVHFFCNHSFHQVFPI